MQQKKPADDLKIAKIEFIFQDTSNNADENGWLRYYWNHRWLLPMHSEFKTLRKQIISLTSGAKTNNATVDDDDKNTDNAM